LLAGGGSGHFHDAVILGVGDEEIAIAIDCHGLRVIEPGTQVKELLERRLPARRHFPDSRWVLPDIDNIDVAHPIHTHRYGIVNILVIVLTRTQNTGKSEYRCRSRRCYLDHVFIVLVVDINGSRRVHGDRHGGADLNASRRHRRLYSHWRYFYDVVVDTQIDNIKIPR
jgi:hypothetical protein